MPFSQILPGVLLAGQAGFDCGGAFAKLDWYVEFVSKGTDELLVAPVPIFDRAFEVVIAKPYLPASFHRTVSGPIAVLSCPHAWKFRPFKTILGKIFVRGS
jgi:hypothetical protein